MPTNGVDETRVFAMRDFEWVPDSLSGSWRELRSGRGGRGDEEILFFGLSVLFYESLKILARQIIKGHCFGQWSVSTSP